MLLLRALSEMGTPGCEVIGAARGGDDDCCIVQGSLAEGCAACTLLRFPNPSVPSPNAAFFCFNTRTLIFAPVLSSIDCSLTRTSGLIGAVADDDEGGERSCWEGWSGVEYG